jgi:HSP20 family protein
MADTNIDVKRDQAATTPAPAQRTETRPAPMEAFHAFRQEMDRMFDRFWRGFGMPSFRRMFESEPSWSTGSEFAFTTPAVNFGEDDKAFHLTAELPGLSEKDIHVNLSGDMLTITGEKREEKEEKEKNYHWSERRFGSFRRAIQVPPYIDRDRIAANFKNGVLSITLPKTPEGIQQQKRIEVKAG